MDFFVKCSTSFYNQPRKIIDVLSVKYVKEELTCLKIAIFKLLYLKLKNYKAGEYYCFKEGSNHSLAKNYIQGIPQGLPQSYLLANICMIEVAAIYDDIFGGQSYYYVDDSVIYTNKYRKSKNLQKSFENDLQCLNIKLEKLNVTQEYMKKNYPACTQKDDILELDQVLNYTIKAHATTGKSEISEINTSKIGNPNLSILGKMASLSSFELLTSFSDHEEITLRNKFDIFKKSIEKEISRIDKIKKDNDAFENYKKYLIRYKKFMKYRERLLAFRQDENPNTIDNLIEKFKIEVNSNKLSSDDLNAFFNEYNEDILVTEIFRLIVK